MKRDCVQGTCTRMITAEFERWYIIIAGIDFAVTRTLGSEDNDDKVQYILIKVYLFEITFYL